MPRYTIELLRDIDFEEVDYVTLPVAAVALFPGADESIQMSPRLERRPRGWVDEDRLVRAATSPKAFIPTIESRPGEKWCAHCGAWRLLSYFAKKTDTYDGHHPYCRECQTALDKRRRLVMVYQKYGLKAA